MEPTTQPGCLGMLLAVLIAVYAGGALALEITPAPALDLSPEQPPADAAGEVYELEMANCQVGHTAWIRPGQVVRIVQGVYRAPTLEEAETMAQGSYPISVDGVRLPTHFSEIVYLEAGVNPLGVNIPAGYGVEVVAEWIATPGQHTINASNYEEGFTCVFTIEP